MAGDSGAIRRLIYGWNCGGYWLKDTADARTEGRENVWVGKALL
jgi:hypothetical protein